MVEKGAIDESTKRRGRGRRGFFGDDDHRCVSIDIREDEEVGSWESPQVVRFMLYLQRMSLLVCVNCEVLTRSVSTKSPPPRRQAILVVIHFALTLSLLCFDASTLQKYSSTFDTETPTSRLLGRFPP